MKQGKYPDKDYENKHYFKTVKRLIIELLFPYALNLLLYYNS